MNPERWAKIEEIFQAALDLDGGEREKFVRKQCGDDDELRRSVEKYIARCEKEDSFLESPVWTDSRFLETKVKRGIAESLDDEISPHEQKQKSFVGERVGVYRLAQEIGKGGMGVVFLGERADNEFRQQVAIKLVKRGMDTDFIVRRFRHERQILANLNHPNIARLLDGGTTGDGTPYFIMEYVEGEPFLKFAAAHNLDLRAKLELFLRAARAVVYAHRKRIVHRDIKPSNILVTPEGEPKLLDFGIAKILDSDSIHDSQMPRTATAMRLMTPEYASPEQIKGEAITEASDQYSLGVLLYELLTGNRPYKFPSRAPHEIARVICEEIPSEPSSGNFGKSFDAETDLRFDADFCQKLDRIVLKSLRKNPTERYASVEEFAQDIERFLRSEATTAESFAAQKANETPDNSAARRKQVAPPVFAESQISATPRTIQENAAASFADANKNQKSIAVLPFKILDAATTGDSVNFLSVGLADAVITRISNVRQLIVRPTSSVVRFGALDADSLHAGRELNVDFVVESSVVKSDKRLRVSIRLLDVRKSSIVWAERFDEDLIDYLDLEDSIAARIVESLLPKLSVEARQRLEKRGTENPQAYEAFLRGRFYWNLFTETGFGQAIAFYRKAIGLDPNYAQAHAAIAEYYVWLGIYGALPPTEAYLAAKQAARQAIDLNESLAEAHAALGMAQIYGDYDWQSGERSMTRALELNEASSTAHVWRAYPLLATRKFDEGVRHIRRAIELDPTSFAAQILLAFAFYFAGRFDDAIEKSAELLDKFPAYPYVYSLQSSVLRLVGKHDEAINHAHKAVELSNGSLLFRHIRAQSLAAANLKIEAETEVAEVEAEAAKTDQFVSFYLIAIVYCFLGDKERAFAALEKAIADRDGLLIWLDVEHSFDRLRDDARFAKMLAKINHPLARRFGNDERDREKSVKTIADFSKAETAPQIVEPETKAISPRWRGVKQGIFVTVLAVLMIPLFLLITVTAIIPPPLTTAIFLLMFLGGAARVLFALLFEDAATKTVSPNRNDAAQINQLKSLSTPRAFETNRPTAENSGENIGQLGASLKQGLFLLLLSFVSVPIFYAVAASTSARSLLQFAVFGVAFCGGFYLIYKAAFAKNKSDAPIDRTISRSPAPKKRRLSAPVKILLATILLAALGLLIDNIASHTTIEFQSSDTPATRK